MAVFFLFLLKRRSNNNNNIFHSAMWLETRANLEKYCVSEIQVNMVLFFVKSVVSKMLMLNLLFKQYFNKLYVIIISK